MIISFYMESLLIDPQMIRHEQQLVVNDNLLRRGGGGREFSDSCSSSTSIIEEEEDEEVSSLQDMSSLLLQLPLKRGLSRHYNGKSQSFTNLSHVKSLGDLAKRENPFKKKIKICSSSSSSRKEPPTIGSHFPS